METNTAEASLISILPDQTLKPEPKQTVEKLSFKDEHAGEKVKNLADMAGFLGSVAALIFGFIIWFRANDIIGFLVGLMIAGGGIFVSYLSLLLLYSFGDMITNSIEQTKILKRLEEKKLTEQLQQSIKPVDEEELKQQEITAIIINQQKAAQTQQVPNFDEDFEDEEEIEVIESKADKRPKKNEKNPLTGVIDSRMRRVAHFAERSIYGIICPVCGRKQSSDQNNCYFCDCRFIYDKEQPDKHDKDLQERLLRAQAK